MRLANLTVLALLVHLAPACDQPYSPPCRLISSSTLEDVDFGAVTQAPGLAPTFGVDLDGKVEITWISGLQPSAQPGTPSGVPRAQLRRVTREGTLIEAHDVPLVPARFGPDPGAAIAWLGDTVWELSVPSTLTGSPPRLDSALRIEVVHRSGTVLRSSEIDGTRCTNCVLIAALRRVGDRVAVVSREISFDQAAQSRAHVLLFDASGALLARQAVESPPERHLVDVLQGLPRRDAVLLPAGDRVQVVGADLIPRVQSQPFRGRSAVGSWDGGEALAVAWADEARNVLVRGLPHGPMDGGREIRVSAGDTVMAFATGARSSALVFADAGVRAFAWLGVDGRKRGGDLILSTFGPGSELLASARGVLLPSGDDRFVYFGISTTGLIREEVACAGD